MSLAALAFLTATPLSLPVCAWDRPGHNRFTGDVVAAVRHYADIPAPVAARLQQRIRDRDFDDMAEIRRDSVEGRYRYEPELRDMHFGTGQICRTTTRANWAPTALERGMVYCEGEHCLIVPTVCGNLSRVSRLPAQAGDAGGGQDGGVGLVPGSVPSTLVPDQALSSVTEPGPSFDEQLSPPGGLTPATTDVASWADGPDGRYVTTLPEPDGRGPGWPSIGESGIGHGGLFGPPIPGTTPPPPPIPEPPTVWLAALGVAGLWGWRRRGRRAGA